MSAPDFSTPVDWDSPSWGHNPIHVAVGGGVDAERSEDQ